LACGSIDGVIEIFDPIQFSIKQDLQYQKDGLYLKHKDPVTSLVFNDDDDVLASGDSNGGIKI